VGAKLQTIVETIGLEKRFGRVQAVDGLDLSVERGDVFGFLGPNGAGKSTTIRAIMGLVRPTRGSVRVFGRDVWRDRVRALRKVGALVESPGLHLYLTARQNMWIMSELAGGVEKKAIDAALARVGLAERANDKVKGFSHGMKQRLGIAQALVADPELVILDEPTTGLDPEGMKEVRQLIRGLAEDHGMTVVLSSHLLYEVEQVCTKVAVINKGKRIAYGPVAELLDGKGRLRIVVNKPAQAMDALRELNIVKSCAIDGTELLVETTEDHAADINRFLVTRGFDVSAVVPQAMSLEDFYFSLLGKMHADTSEA
jgi:ABC-type multidrug transport system ATPase subunit